MHVLTSTVPSKVKEVINFILEINYFVKGLARYLERSLDGLVEKPVKILCQKSCMSGPTVQLFISFQLTH